MDLAGKNGVLAPGFRFHPTDEELVGYYLKRKICRKKLRVEAIGETDVYKFDPEDLPEKALHKTRDRQWFFFSLRDKRHGSRLSRATGRGYWKATGKDRVIKCDARSVGEKKTLVFHRGRAPKGERTNWVMHEYTLHKEELKRCGADVKDSYVLSKIYKKSGCGPKNGEQYGAPFVEEEWSDDGDEPTDLVDVPANQFVVSADVGNDIWLNGINQLALDDKDIEELLKQVSDQPGDVGFSTMQQDDLSGLSSHVETFNTENLEEDMYLEIDDLLLSEPEPEPDPTSVEAMQKNWSQDDSIVLNDNDFIDIDSFLLDCGATSPQPEPVSDGSTNGFEQSLQLVTDQADSNQFQHQTEKNQASNWPLRDSYIRQINNGSSWTQELKNDELTATRFGELPVTGDASEFINPLITSDITKKDVEANGSSQFASSLWDFLESIPANPAYASENPFVKLNLVKMSSHGGRFRRASKSTSNNVLVTVNDSAAKRKKSRGNNHKVFFFLLIIGALCALVWLVIVARRVSERSLLC